MPTLKKSMPRKDSGNSTPLEKFEAMGFKTLEPPEEGKMPKMVNKFSGNSTTAIGDLMAKYAAWREYAEDQHERETGKYVMMNERYENLFDQHMIATEGRNITEKKTVVRAIPELKALRKNLTEQEILVSLLSTRVESLNNSIAVISREITRRGQNNDPR